MPQARTEPRAARGGALWGVAAPATFVVLWATGFPFAKEALHFAAPMTILAVRFALSGLLLGAIAIAGRATWPDRRTAGHVAVAGLLIHVCYIGGVFAAIDHGVPAGLTALIVGVQPLLAACLVGPLLGERVLPLQWLGFLLGVAGVALVVVEKLTFDGATAVGLLLAILALTGSAVGTIYQKRHCAHVDLRSASVVQYAAATAAVLVLAAAFEPLRIRWTAQFGLALGWMVIVLSLGSATLLLALIRHGAATQVASLYYLVPPIAAVISWLWLGERLGASALAGIAIAATGVALVQRGGMPGNRRAPHREPLPAFPSGADGGPRRAGSSPNVGRDRAGEVGLLGQDAPDAGSPHRPGEGR